MESASYKVENIEVALQTFSDIEKAILRLIKWNTDIFSTECFYSSEDGMKLLSANCMLIAAIGEGIHKCQKILPGYLNHIDGSVNWNQIIGMRNHIAHGYFQIDGDVVFYAVKNDIPALLPVIKKSVESLKELRQ